MSAFSFTCRLFCLLVLYLYPVTWSPGGCGSDKAAAPRGATAGFSGNLSYLGPAWEVIVRCPKSPSPQSQSGKRKRENTRHSTNSRKRKERTRHPPALQPQLRSFVTSAFSFVFTPAFGFVCLQLQLSLHLSSFVFFS